MTPKTIGILYWVFTIMILGIMGGGGVANLLHTGGSVEILQKLGYPTYFSSFLGVTKILGIMAILLPVPPTLREWAYAGFTFDVCAAVFSLFSIGVPFIQLTIPILALIAVQGSSSVGVERRQYEIHWQAIEGSRYCA